MKFSQLLAKTLRRNATPEAPLGAPAVVPTLTDRPPQPQSRSGVLLARGLKKTYKQRTVVDGASLGVRRGESVGLLGPNGAGKTTCFYMITGLIQPDAGTIELDGHDVTRMPMYRRARLGIGYLPQEASIFRGLSVENNIRAVLEVVEKSKKEREKQLDSLLEEFKIGHLRKSSSIALSGGERRRLEIAVNVYRTFMRSYGTQIDHWIKLAIVRVTGIKFEPPKELGHKMKT